MMKLYAVVYKDYNRKIGLEIFGGNTPEEAVGYFVKAYPAYTVLDAVWTGEEGKVEQ